MAIRTIIRSMTGIGTGSTNLELAIDTWPPDVVIRWNWIAAVNKDSRGTNIDLYLKRGSQKYYFKVDKQTNYNYTVEVWPRCAAPGDFQVCANFVGAADGDDLELYAFGEIEDDGGPE